MGCSQSRCRHAGSCRILQRSLHEDTTRRVSGEGYIRVHTLHIGIQIGGATARLTSRPGQPHCSRKFRAAIWDPFRFAGVGPPWSVVGLRRLRRDWPGAGVAVISAWSIRWSPSSYPGSNPRPVRVPVPWINPIETTCDRTVTKRAAYGPQLGGSAGDPASARLCTKGVRNKRSHLTNSSGQGLAAFERAKGCLLVRAKSQNFWPTKQV